MKSRDRWPFPGDRERRNHKSDARIASSRIARCRARRGQLAGEIPVGIGALMVIIMSLTGCVPAKINAGFPDVPPIESLGGTDKIGVARVEDSRSDDVAGSTEISPFQDMELIVGPDLRAYIRRRFQNALANRGFDPVAALDPTRTSISQPYKIVVVTIQSVRFGYPAIAWGKVGSSVDIAVQIYSPPRNLIFSGSYSGTHDERPAILPTGTAAGSIIAVSAEEAIKAAFADPNFVRALR